MSSPADLTTFCASFNNFDFELFDVRPSENNTLPQGMRACVADFGLSMALTVQTMSRPLVAGTLKYQAPEQLRIRELLSRKQLNREELAQALTSINTHPLAVDVYAFGCLLHELTHVGTAPSENISSAGPAARPGQTEGWLKGQDAVQVRLSYSRNCCTSLLVPLCRARCGAPPAAAVEAEDDRGQIADDSALAIASCVCSGPAGADRT